jgi:hypothetical protein
MRRRKQARRNERRERRQGREGGDTNPRRGWGGAPLVGHKKEKGEERSDSEYSHMLFISLFCFERTLERNSFQ